MSQGARLEPAAQILGLTAQTLQRWRNQKGGIDRRRGPLTSPVNNLTPAERWEALSVANTSKYRELSPKQIVSASGRRRAIYCFKIDFLSDPTEQNKQAHREHGRPAPHRRPREKVFTGPFQVWYWKITYLKTMIPGRFFYLYMVLDVWSHKKIMAATIFTKDCGHNSALLFVEAFHRHNVDPKGLALDSDNGGPMKDSTILPTLQRLGVVPSSVVLVSAMTTPSRSRCSVP